MMMLRALEMLSRNSATMNFWVPRGRLLRMHIPRYAFIRTGGAHA